MIGFDENIGVVFYGFVELVLMFIIDIEGFISVNGLLDSNYILVEIKVLDGY